jgi:hypoxanthine phosphoribosyltransferase
MSLFQTGVVKLHAGGYSNFKIDCDALTDQDIGAIAMQLTLRLPRFAEVEGVPGGGLRLAEAMKHYVTPFQPIRVQPLLIVDDVFTTGASMEEHRDFRTGVIGAVIFARAETPVWITPLFRMEP